MKKLLFLLFLVPAQFMGAQSIVAPTSSTETIRMDTYLDSVGTMAYNPFSVQFSSDNFWMDKDYWISSGTTVNIWTADYGTSTYIYAPIDLETYTQKVIDNMMNQLTVQGIINTDMEQYAVWFDMNPPDGWQGWCTHTNPPDGVNGQCLDGDVHLPGLCP